MPTPVPQRSQTFGYLLRATYELLQHQIYAGLHEDGFPDVREAHSNVLRNLPPDGARMTDLAKSAGISKQSIAYLVDDLCRLGYVEMHEHPTDGRAKQVRFSERGRALIALLVQESSKAEKECARIIGEHSMDLVRDALVAIIRELGVGPTQLLEQEEKLRTIMAK